MVICCICTSYLKSENCLKEFNWAMGQPSPKIIPLFFEDKNIFKEAFGKWPPEHIVFKKLGDTVYDNNKIAKILENPADSLGINKDLQEFINKLKKI